jgi:retron-type reverse transcriptase
LDAIYIAITQKKVSWILDADIQGFFDNLDHEWLLKFIRHRISDKRILRRVERTLKAGVEEEGVWSKTTVGTPQGSVISPLYANIYLHYVLDLWVEQWLRRKARGEVYIVRYRDDFVLGFQYRSDGERFLQALKIRLKQFRLSLHKEKTRLIEFGRLAISCYRK